MTHQASRDANSPKHDLMRIVNNLEAEGKMAAAKALDKLCGRIEAWQHRSDLQ